MEPGLEENSLEGSDLIRLVNERTAIRPSDNRMMARVAKTRFSCVKNMGRLQARGNSASLLDARHIMCIKAKSQ